MNSPQRSRTKISVLPGTKLIVSALFLCLVLLGTSVFAGATIARVQSASVTSRGVTSLSQNFPAANTAGNLIVAFVRASGTTGTFTVTDTQGNTYKEAVAQAQTSDNYQAHIFYAANVKGGANTVTINFGGANDYPFFAIYEYSGISTTNPLDQTAHAQGSGTAASSGSTPTTTSANELVFAGTSLKSSYSGTVTAGSGFTMGQKNIAANTPQGATEDRVVAATGSYQGNFTLGTSGTYATVAATFAAASTTAPAPAPAPAPTPSTPARVQSASVTSRGVASLSQNFPAANTAGNLIVAFIRASGTSGTFSVTDSQGNVYKEAVAQAQTSDNYQAHLFYAANVKAGANTVTANFGASNDYPFLAIYEYSGVNTTNPLDQTAHAQGGGTAASSGSTGTTSSANELVFAGTALKSSYSGTVTAGSGFTMGQKNVTSGTPEGATEDRVVSSTGSYPGNFTLGTSGTYAAVVATFLPASATASPSPSPSTVSVSISPTSTTVTAGKTYQFSATVSGTTTTTVTWQVNGVTGGSTSTGTISTSGLYTAPLTSSSMAVTVTARSYYDTTKYANSAVTVAPTTQSSSGNDYYVSTSGNDSNNGSSSSPWRTINHAASLAKPGMTIHVLPGTYVENVKTTVSGTSTSRIRFISDTRWGARIAPTAGTDVWTNNGNYVDIVGFDMSGKTANHGVLNWASYTRVLGNNIHDIYVPISGGCTNGGAAIDHAQYTASNNDTIGNVINQIGTATSGSCAHGIYMAMPYGNIQNNLISNTTKWGITTWHAGSNLVITNNTIFENHGSGAIQIGQGDAGVTSGTDYSNINNNIMYNNAIGIELEGTVGSHNTYDHNLMYGNSTNWYNASSTSASLTNTVSAAPAFTNYQANGTGDYHLQSTSPAVDKGTVTGAPNYDQNGGQRPMGGADDIGAYEYSSSAAAWPWTF